MSRKIIKLISGLYVVTKNILKKLDCKQILEKKIILPQGAVRRELLPGDDTLFFVFKLSETVPR